MKFGVILTLFLGSLFTASAKTPVLSEEPRHEERGEIILKEILSQPWSKDWEGATLEDVTLVKQKADLEVSTGLPPVWSATISGPDERTGHVMWDCWGEGRLVEFALDAELKIEGDQAGALTGVPGLQQFAMRDAEGRLVASGCVPTAAGSVVAFWSSKQFPQWRGADGRTKADLAKRLRSRLTMTLYPDTDGFTENGMALAGAFPGELAKALRDDAREHEVPIACKIAKFSMAQLKEEIAAKRPVLLSCVVRVAHQPELSWGHEVAGVGWAKIDGVELAGVLDNFYPTRFPEAIRWIRGDAFRSIIILRPIVREKE